MHRLYPEDLSFESTDDIDQRTQGQRSNVSWANVLLGRAREKFMGRFRPVNLPKQDTITRI